MEELPKCRLARWADVDRWADRLANLVREADRVPDVIVGLTRGGWVPSRLVADRLGVKRMLAVRAQHWGVTATKSGKAEITEELSGPVRGLNALVVDDITDTGESLALASRHVQERGPTRTETAACRHLGHSKFIPTYFAEEIPRGSWVWVVFPWNYWEDLANLAGRAMAAAGEVKRANRLLAEKCGLFVPLVDVRRAVKATSV